MIMKRQVGSIKPGQRSVYNTTPELRMALPSQVHSPSPAWSYHSNWSDDLSTPHNIPPSPPNGCQPVLCLGHLENTYPRREVPLVVPQMSSPNIPNRETRPLGFGCGRDRGIWYPSDNSSLTPVHGGSFSQGFSNFIELLELEEVVLTCPFIASLNPLSSLSKICTIQSHFSVISPTYTPV